MEGAVGYANVPPPPPERPSPDMRCNDNFPSLSGEAMPTCMGGRGVQYRGGGNFKMTEENFPALHGSSEQMPNQTLNISLQRGGGTAQRPTSNNLSIKVKQKFVSLIPVKFKFILI